MTIACQGLERTSRSKRLQFAPPQTRAAATIFSTAVSSLKPSAHRVASQLRRRVESTPIGCWLFSSAAHESHGFRLVALEPAET
jgi:hypothetical protein